MDEPAFYRTAELESVIATMARRVARTIEGPQQLLMVGILRRGAPLADRICSHLRRIWKVDAIERLDLDIKRYADDLSLLYPDTRLQVDPQREALDLRGRTVVLVDDVLYQGHSMLRAIEWLARRRPDAIRTAVVVDRACARLPIRADFAGITLEVAPLQIVELRVPPYEPEFEMRVLRRDSDAVPGP
jgi:pyrimidine operon attenuation protein / uracil phosphoribosyltransferase